MSCPASVTCPARRAPYSDREDQPIYCRDAPRLYTGRSEQAQRAIRHPDEETTVPVPNAVIIGAQKAATTGLYVTLATHPDVLALDVPEVGVLHKGVDGWEAWLRARDPSIYQRAGEATLVAKLATAMYFSDTLENVRVLNERARVIAILRHPVDRMLSLHRYAAQRGLETRSAEQALRADVVERAHHWRLRSYSEGSRYATAIQRVRQTFGDEALFVDYADVQSGVCLPAIQEFLGLPLRDIRTLRANESRAPRNMAVARTSASPRFQRVARRALPVRWRTRIRRKVEQWNSTSRLPQQEPLSESFRSELTERYLTDVLAAEKVLTRELPLWRT